MNRIQLSHYSVFSSESDDFTKLVSLCSLIELQFCSHLIGSVQFNQPDLDAHIIFIYSAYITRVDQSAEQK